jgi:hypothetical protein
VFRNSSVYLPLGVLRDLEIPVCEVDRLEEIEHWSRVDDTEILKLIDNLNKIY